MTKTMYVLEKLAASWQDEIAGHIHYWKSAIPVAKTRTQYNDVVKKIVELRKQLNNTAYAKDSGNVNVIPKLTTVFGKVVAEIPYSGEARIDHLRMINQQRGTMVKPNLYDITNRGKKVKAL